MALAIDRHDNVFVIISFKIALERNVCLFCSSSIPVATRNVNVC